MKFCRNCGASLAAQAPAAQAPAAAAPKLPSVGAPMMAPAYGTPAPAYSPPPFSGAPKPEARSPSGPAPVAQGSTINCPRCGTNTPLGFTYCQQCGLQLQAVAPTDPGASRGRPESRPPPLGPQSSIDQFAGTIAQPGTAAAALAPPPRASEARVDSRSNEAPMRPSELAQRSFDASSSAAKAVTAVPPGAAWATAVLVNRDGTDGQRFALTSDDTLIGRAGADIAFDDDRFLAKQHARIERASDGTIKIHPIDTVNGVYRKADGAVELADGAVLLVGREVLRFERVAPEERTVNPLVRHGVALFGSPPRDPWGRLFQLIPSAGFRDIRHLVGNEVVLGREEGEIVFRDDAFMSRRHAALTWDGKRAMLTDLGSSNGTFVRISGPTTLKYGDHVRVGDQLLRIER